MDSIIGCDSGPLISLARIQHLHLFEVFKTIHIPQGVYQEVVVQSQGRPGSELQGQSWIVTHPDPNAIPLEISILGRGEATAILLALQLDAEILLIDDRQARSVAQRLGVRYAGTLNLLQRAKQLGIISEVRSILDALAAADFRISKGTRQAFLQSLGE